VWPASSPLIAIKTTPHIDCCRSLLWSALAALAGGKWQAFLRSQPAGHRAVLSSSAKEAYGSSLVAGAVSAAQERLTSACNWPVGCGLLW
jgi:hypothetical protein